MKSTEKPKLSHEWWESNRPPELESTELDEVLPKVDKSLSEQRKKKNDSRAIDACLAALRDVPGAAAKTIKQCDKKKHKNEIAVLKRFDDLVSSEIQRLEKAKAEVEEEEESGEEDEEEENEDKIFQPDYLYKMVKLLKSGNKKLNFGFGLDTKNPEASTLVLMRKGKPERLFKELKKTGDFSKRLLTFGKAFADPQDGKTLVFELSESAGEPPQIQKLGRQFLRADKNLKFRKLKLVLPGGKTFSDTDE